MLNRRDWLKQGIGWSLCAGSLPAFLAAAERGQRKPRYGEFNPDHESLDMFDGIDDGRLVVRLIPKDASETSILIENKTDKPLNVELPPAFAGTPILAQFGAGGAGGAGGQQAVGGGAGGAGGGGGAGGFFNVVPEKLVQLKAPLVCLEHGKDEPNGGQKYEIKKVASVNAKPGVYELCKMIGAAMLPHAAAQAAAWHLANDMSWEELSQKFVRRANGLREPYFNARDLQVAMQAAVICIKQAEENKSKEERSPGETGNS